MLRLSSLILAAYLISAIAALDCRKFSFAPACRGILLKRASTTQEFELATKSCMTPSEVLGKVLEAAHMAGYTDTVDMSFLRSFYNKAVTETVALEQLKQQA